MISSTKSSTDIWIFLYLVKCRKLHDVSFLYSIFRNCLMHNVMIFGEHPVYSFRVYLFVSRVCGYVFFFLVLCMLFSFIVGSFEIFLLILRICRFQCVCDGCIDACMHTLLSFLKVSLIWLPLCAPRYIMGVILKVDALDFHPKLTFSSSACNMRIYIYMHTYTY